MSRFVIGLIAMAMFVLPQPAGAGGSRQARDVLTFPAVTMSSPAGGLCDFNYEIENSDLVKRIRFYDADGVRYRALLVNDEVNIHRNLDTGVELEEDLQYVLDRNFVDDTVTQSGHFWALRSEGNMVYSAGGRLVTDRLTGEVYEATPQAAKSFADIVCPLLGGHVAP